MGALSDLKILDFSTLIPGPMSTMFLADMGADVVNVVGPGRHDLMDDFPPYNTDLEMGACTAWLGRNKRSVALNLKKPEAVEAVKRMVMEYDIVVDQFRPGVMDRMGIGYEALRAVNPRVVFVSLTGYGQTGPLAMRPGHDINYMAISGNLLRVGVPGDEPCMPNFQLPDVAGGSFMTTIAVLAAVHYRERTGVGQYVDVAMLDSILPFCCIEATGELAAKKYAGWPHRTMSGLALGPSYGFFKTADDRWMSVGALEPKFYLELLRALDLNEYADGKIAREEPEKLEAILAEKFLTRTQAEWTAYFKDYDTCVEPVLTMDEMIGHEQVVARDMVPEVPLSLHPEKSVQQIGMPLKFSETPVEYRHTAFPAGYHTGEILKAFGYDDEAIASLSSK